MEEYYRQRKAVQRLYGGNELDVFSEYKNGHCSYNVEKRR